MESALVPGVGAEEPSGVLGVERANGCPGNSGEPSRPRRLRGGGKRCPAYNRRTREVAWVVERQSERVVVLGGRESRPRGEGPVLHRCTGRRRRTLMSAVSARSVSRTVGRGSGSCSPTRALPLCQAGSRIAVSMPSMTRSPAATCCWRAWGEVRANRGAPGVDGVTIGGVVDSGVGEFLDELAAKLQVRDLPAEAAAAGAYPQAGQAGTVAAARYPLCGRPGGDGGGEDRARADLRSRLPPVQLRV